MNNYKSFIPVENIITLSVLKDGSKNDLYKGITNQQLHIFENINEREYC